VIGLIAQLALLAIVARTVGLSATGWLVGVACSVTATVLLAAGLGRSRAAAFGPANWVTLARAALVGAVAALIADGFSQPAPVAVLVTLTVVALLLDAVDGRVARRTSTASALGARFDMEVDAFLIFMLSAYVANSLGAWVLAIGVARYGFVAAGWFLPWMREQPPPRYWCKVVAAIQGIVLTIAVADVVPNPEMAAAVVVAMALLAESFGSEVWWLWRHRQIPALAESHRLVLVGADALPAIGRH
jgi:phosphatidylglycerophosphate synthase